MLRCLEPIRVVKAPATIHPARMGPPPIDAILEAVIRPRRDPRPYGVPLIVILEPATPGHPHQGFLGDRD